MFLLDPLTCSSITSYFVNMQTEGVDEPAISEITPYALSMPRKLTKTRGKQGAFLASLRRDAGLTQTQLADAIGEKQQTIAYWERSARPARSDAIPKLARILGVSSEDLLQGKGQAPPKRLQRSGPSSKIQKLFEEVSQLPRRQQDKVIEFVAAFVEQHKRKAS